MVVCEKRTVRLLSQGSQRFDLAHGEGDLWLLLKTESDDEVAPDEEAHEAECAECASERRSMSSIHCVAES